MSGERVTTGSEPRRERAMLAARAALKSGVRSEERSHAIELLDEALRVVELDHDERAEGWLTETHAAAFSEGHKAGVKAVVEALRERAAEQSDSRAPAYPAQFYRVTARWLAERFNLTESGGDDDDKQLP